jgi:hypothetical protein
MATAAGAATVTITAPADGAMVSGTVNITLQVSPSYTGADIYLDGGTIGSVSPDTTPANTIRLDTSRLANGPHTIMATAFYGDDNGSAFLGQDSLTLEVRNDATVTIVAPSASSTVAGTIDVTIQVNTEYTGAYVYLDDGWLGSVSPNTTPAHTLRLDTQQLPDGVHTIRALAFFSGNTMTTFIGYASLSVHVDNSAVTADKYGGRNDVVCTGGIKAHFYREKIGKRWWLCTPQGHGFISISAYAVSWTGLADRVLDQKYSSGGPAANNAPKFNWAYRMAQRYGGWGFNSYGDYTETGAAAHILPWLVDSAAWPGGDHTIPIKMPYVTIHASSSASQRNLGTYAPAPAKGWRIGLKPVLDLSDFYPPYLEGVDYFDPNWSAYIDGNFDQDSYYTSQRAVNGDWLLGVSFDDLDFIKFAGPGDAFPTVVHGQREEGRAHHTPHWGLLTLIASPVHSVDTDHLNGQFFGEFRYVLYQDEIFHAKRSFIGWLQRRHASIQALNASWGLGSCGDGGYCSFASEASVYTEQLCPDQWDGVKYRCAQTLNSPPSPLTLRVTRGGVLIGGDDASGYHGAAGSPTGLFWGPGIAGGFDSVNYSTKTVSLTFANSQRYVYPNKVAGSNIPDTILPNTPIVPGLVTIGAEGPHYCQDDGNGSLVKYLGSGLTRQDEYTCSGRIDYATGAITDMVITPAFTGQWMNIDYATPAPPAAGATPTIEYKSGGWGVGLGVADEDGTCPAAGSNRCWMPTASWTLADVNVNMKRDLDDFLQYYAATAFSGERAVVQKYVPGALLFCNSGSYDTPAHAPVLKAMGGYCDVALDSSAFSEVGVNDVDMVDRYNYFIANVGDMPIGSWEGFGANPDSNLNTPDHMKTSPPVAATQAERAATYAAMMDAALNTRDSTYDSYHFVAWKWWALVDTPGEGYNWGLIDNLDNAYDGHEATTGTAACSPPVESYTCGGDNGDWGNFLGPVTTANRGWLSLPPN